VFTQDKGAFFERRWRVEQIQSAVKYVVNDIVGNYGTRFPSEPFFARGFQGIQAPSVFPNRHGFLALPRIARSRYSKIHPSLWPSTRPDAANELVSRR
jgi:hypothetical protein